MKTQSSRLRIAGILAGFLLLLLFIPMSPLFRAQSDENYDHGIIAYSKTEPTDPIAQLQKRMDSGKVRLQFEPRLGYLRSILRELNVPISSQSMVFSKT